MLSKTDSGMEIRSNFIVLAEFDIGLIMILWGIDALTPLLDLHFIFVIGLILSVPLLLYISIGIILGAFEDWKLSKKICNSIPLMLLVGILLFGDIISVADLSIIVVLCGITYILLSAWNLLTQSGRSGAEGEI